MRAWRSVAIAALGALAVAGCGDDGSAGGGDDGSTAGDGDAIGLDVGGDAADDAEADGDGPLTGWEVPAETDAWRILWRYSGRFPENKDQAELWLMDAKGLDKASLTDLAGLPGLDPPLSCDLGCFVSPDLRFLAVATQKPGEGSATYTLRIGQFNSDLEVSLFKGVEWKDIIDFEFAGTNIFYTKKNPACAGLGCQFDLYRVPLAPSPGAPVLVQTYPTEADLEQSIYQGRFKASPDGKHVILLNPTIRSVTVNMWKEGLGLVELDYVCKFGTKGNCSGTGSEYSDEDPVAVSPDGRWVVFFTFSDRWQRARVYDTQNPGTVRLTVIGSVPSGSYIEKACEPGALAPWQWRRVVGDPQFTPDGQEVVFLTESSCPLTDPALCDGATQCQPKKPRRDIRRIKLARLLEEGTLTQADIFNVTGNEDGDVPENRQVTGFSVAPDGATVVFTATPDVDQSGKPLKDGDARQRNDQEVYRVRLDGTNRKALTNDLAWMAGSPKVVPLENP